jgi:hypothetical protein
LLAQVSWPLQVIGYRQAELWPDRAESILTGETVKLDVAPYTDKARSSTMLPFRYIGDVMGTAVGWDASTRQVSFKLNDTAVVLTLGQKTAYVNGQPVQMPLAPVIIKNRTFIPLRFVSESLGAFVYWNSKTGQITIKVWEDPEQ